MLDMWGSDCTMDCCEELSGKQWCDIAVLLLRAVAASAVFTSRVVVYLCLFQLIAGIVVDLYVA
jgi:hypothetical protein